MSNKEHDNAKKYEELYAMAVLEDILPLRFNNGENRECPDLMFFDNVGVEVTSCVSNEEREYESLYIKLRCEKLTAKEKTNICQRMDDIKSEYEKTKGHRFLPMWGIKYYPDDEPCEYIHQLYEAVEKKVKTIKKGHYIQTKTLYLFIFSNIIIVPSQIRITASKVKEICCESSITSVFINSITENKLIEFDIINDKQKEYSYGTKQVTYANKAYDASGKLKEE